MRLRKNTVQTLGGYSIRPRVACNYSVGTVSLPAITVGNAWPYFAASGSLPQQESGVTSLDVAPLTPPSSTNADQCLPLLKSFLHTTQSALGRSQRTAGQSPVVVFHEDVRFAPGQGRR